MFDTFEEVIAQDLGVSVLRDDREVFVIANVTAETIARVEEYLGGFWKRYPKAQLRAELRRNQTAVQRWTTERLFRFVNKIVRRDLPDFELGLDFRFYRKLPIGYEILSFAFWPYGPGKKIANGAELYLSLNVIGEIESLHLAWLIDPIPKEQHFAALRFARTRITPFAAVEVKTEDEVSEYVTAMIEWYRLARAELPASLSACKQNYLARTPRQRRADPYWALTVARIFDNPGYDRMKTACATAQTLRHEEEIAFNDSANDLADIQSFVALLDSHPRVKDIRRSIE
jgi:hypothetical protein